jgi:hypothetical protein
MGGVLERSMTTNKCICGSRIGINLSCPVHGADKGRSLSHLGGVPVMTSAFLPVGTFWCHPDTLKLPDADAVARAVADFMARAAVLSAPVSGEAGDPPGSHRVEAIALAPKQRPQLAIDDEACGDTPASRHWFGRLRDRLCAAYGRDLGEARIRELVNEARIGPASSDEAP